MASGTSLSTGSGAVSLTVSSSGYGTAGGITVDSISGGTVTLVSGDSILRTSSGTSDNIVAATANLTVSDGTGTIGANGTNNELVVNAPIVNTAQTGGGDIFISDDNTSGMTVGTINATANGDVILYATAGSILAAAGATPNVTGSLLGLNTTWTGGSASIGTAGSPLRTDVNMIGATTYNGGIYLADTGGTVIVSSVVAHQVEGGNSDTPHPNGNGPIVMDSNNDLGTYDVSITATDGIILGTLTAPDNATVTSTSSYIWAADNENTVTAQTVYFSAADDIGQSSLSILNTVQTLNAVSTTGNVYLSEGQLTTIASVVANQNASVTTDDGTLTVGTLTASNSGTATVSTTNGSIVSDSSTITAGTVDLSASEGIGASGSGNVIDTTASNVSATVTGGATNSQSAAAIYVTNSTSLSSASATTNNGQVTIDSAGGSLIATPNDSSTPPTTC